MFTTWGAITFAINIKIVNWFIQLSNSRKDITLPEAVEIIEEIPVNLGFTGFILVIMMMKFDSVHLMLTVVYDTFLVYSKITLVYFKA